jgi:hypothetical protein
LQRAVIPGAGQEAKPTAVAAALRPAGHWLWFVALIAAVLIAAFAVPKAEPQTPPVAVDEAAVLAADTELANAVRVGDKSVSRRLLALQFSFVDAAGKPYARKDFLDDLKALAASPATDVKVRSYGLVTLITGHRLSPQNGEVFFLDIWARQKGTWRELVSHEVATAMAEASAAGSAPAAETQTAGCKNPCQSIPYRVRSASEQDVITAFQAIETAVVAHDAGEWSKHVADEFVVYRTGRAPMAKSDRVAAIERQKQNNTAVAVGEVQSMRLAVYGDAAAMIADQAVPEDSRPPYRAARLWVRRGGQWLLAISVQTDVK